MPFFLLLGFKKETPKQKGQKGTTREPRRDLDGKDLETHLDPDTSPEIKPGSSRFGSIDTGPQLVVEFISKKFQLFRCIWAESMPVGVQSTHLATDLFSWSIWNAAWGSLHPAFARHGLEEILCTRGTVM